MINKLKILLKLNTKYILFISLIASWLGIVIFSYLQNNTKLYVSIDSFTLKNRDSVSFGSTGDFHLNHIKKPFYMVFKDTSIQINLNRNQYIKINNTNVNLYKIQGNNIIVGDSVISKTEFKNSLRSDFKYKNIGYIFNNSKIKSIAYSDRPKKSDFDIEIIALDTMLKKENGEPYFKFSKSLNNKKNKYKIEAFNLYRTETILKNDSIPKSFMDPIPIKNNFGNEVYVLEKLEKDIKIHFTKKITKLLIIIL